MNEHSLHAEIKNWYSAPGDHLETKVDGFIIDIVRGSLLIEVQTRNFFAIKEKLTSLLDNHRVRLIHPIPERKYLVHINTSGEVIRRRKSPKRGRLVDLFSELVSIPSLIRADNFSIEVLMIEEEETRCNDGRGSWRRRGVSITDKKLLCVTDRVLFRNAKAFLRFLPRDLNVRFTNKKLARKAGISISLARKITYCLRKMGVISTTGKRGKALEFQRTHL